MTTHAGRGFTLVELVIVIAIIGILSAVVMVSIGDSRNKSRDASIQSNMHSFQVQAENYYYTPGENTYGSAVSTGDCALDNTVFASANTRIQKILAALEGLNGASDDVVCNSTPSAYAVSSPLIYGVNGNMYWCVDSTGRATDTAAPLGSGEVACP